eukprot:18308-Eustigmatos_ZCMA.PRE.1
MPVGNAPQLDARNKSNKRQINAADPFRAIYPALRTLLRLDKSVPLFVFVNNSFSPGPDEKFGD